MNGALVKACNKSLTLSNTGSECNDQMGPLATLYAVPPGLRIPASSLNTFAAYLETQIHAAKGARIYPLFGATAQIRKITNAKEADVTATLDDGTVVFIRYGVLNRTLSTTEGGICFAQSLQSFVRSGYSVIEVDDTNQVLLRDNGDGTYGGLRTTFMYSPSPDFADFKNPGFTNFAYSYKPEEYLGAGAIFHGDASIASLVGLLDVDLVVGDSGVSSTTKLKFHVQTDCASTDLVALLGNTLAVVANFVVTDHATGAAVTPTAAAIVSGHIELTGTYVSAHSYDVALAAPSVLLVAGIPGYDGTVPLTIAIP